jgi:Fanconi anemia group J protein
MDSFSSELAMQFPIRLETNHVVDTSKQLWAGALPNDPSGNLVFNWSFKNTENVRLQDALGEAVSQICGVTPGGVLVFFSSYSVLNKVVLRWKSTGFLSAQLSQQKCVLVEPSGPIDSVIAAFYRANGDNSKMKKEAKSGKFKKVADGEVRPSQTGGLLLAVCRGKVSEGIDFSDQHCRAVVIVGLPFPNTKDLQLRLKKEDHETKARTVPGMLNGGAWYTLQAFRALNQAIGR